MTNAKVGAAYDFIVIGGGAAGFFGAISAAEAKSGLRIAILEGTRRPLTKVRLSGGGRCNVTHNCFEPRELVKSYPRGHREMLQVLSRFQPRDTIDWFLRHGVELKAEADGRMFPTTDSSETIIDCLTKTAARLGVETKIGAAVKGVTRNDESGLFEVRLASEVLHAKNVLLATGSFAGGYDIAKAFGHTIAPLAPSLFTFVVKDERLRDLSGVSFPRVEAKLDVGGNSFVQHGPLLITHWGLSGPAVLKLSAFAARELLSTDYKAKLTLKFLDWTSERLLRELDAYKANHPTRIVHKNVPFALPSRFWERLVETSGISSELRFAELRKESARRLADEIVQGQFEVVGKGEFKEEFVTCGGVTLKEVDFKRMESKLRPGLFFAGEVLDIDGITGGFNFQNAWSTSFIAGQAAASNS